MIKVKEGIYVAIQNENSFIAVDGNSIIIINEEDVVVVDSRLLPSAAAELVTEIRKLTDKPVRFLINTHAHDDHVWGNETFKINYPAVEIISHPKTRLYLETTGIPMLKTFIEKTTPDYVKSVDTTLATNKRSNGEPLTHETRARFIKFKKDYQQIAAEWKSMKPVLPTLTIETELTLNRAKRKIKIMHLGRGNSDADLVVYLPQDKVLIMGDLLVSPIPYSFGSFLGEWVQTLNKLKEFEADFIIPGHGAVQKDKQYLELVSALLDSTFKQTQAAVQKGLTLEETRKTIDLESFRKKFAGDDKVLNSAFINSFLNPAVERAYKEAKGEIEKD